MTSTAAPAMRSLSMRSPAFWGGVGSMVVALGLLVLSVKLFFGTSTPKTLNVALTVIAIALASAGYLTLLRKRVAWAFALSINGTCSTVLLFTAPRMRDSAEISILLALLPCLVFALLLLLLSIKAEEF